MGVRPGVESNAMNPVGLGLLQNINKLPFPIGLALNDIQLVHTGTENIGKQSRQVVHATDSVNFWLSLAQVSQVGAVKHQERIFRHRVSLCS
eukprot:TRINITY_DN35757_c0_g1_i1.p2 TRINITY_DN35757_c0_g1~~TRINITY_DN35757_c0_g1_i1.p2  ORF type:complete len:108 (+),score=20.44 TRINITY_DN35757_c0_g1_i1:49-324(+)